MLFQHGSLSQFGSARRNPLPPRHPSGEARQRRSASAKTAFVSLSSLLFSYKIMSTIMTSKATGCYFCYHIVTKWSPGNKGKNHYTFLVLLVHFFCSTEKNSDFSLIPAFLCTFSPSHFSQLHAISVRSGFHKNSSAAAELFEIYLLTSFGCRSSASAPPAGQ